MRVFVSLAVLAVLEIYVLVLVGSHLGFLGLLALLLASALVGGWALRREGRRSLTALVDAARRGRPAEAEVADGMYVALAGLLLVVPGILTTLAALVLLVPPVRRALARRAASRAVRAGSARRGPTITVVGAGAAGRGPAGGAGRGGPVVEGRVLESEVVRPDGTSPDRGTGAIPNGL